MYVKNTDLPTVSLERNTENDVEVIQRLRRWAEWLKSRETIGPRPANGHLDRFYRSPQWWESKPIPRDLIPDYEAMEIEKIILKLYQGKLTKKWARLLRLHYVWKPEMPKRLRLLGLSRPYYYTLLNKSHFYINNLTCRQKRLKSS